MQLKHFKNLVSQAQLITIHGAPVRFTINEQCVFLEWRGLQTGKLFSGYVVEVATKAFKQKGINGVAIKLASIEEVEKEGKKERVWVFNEGHTFLEFFNLIEMPIE